MSRSGESFFLVIRGKDPQISLVSDSSAERTLRSVIVHAMTCKCMCVCT